MSSPPLHVVAFPMHGESKLRREGLRTRDAHLLEWLTRLGTSVDVVSRPEPWPRTTLARRRRSSTLPAGWRLISVERLVSPFQFLRDKRRWWAASARWLPPTDPALPVIGWNVIALANAVEAGRRAPVVFDLLDDWTIHPAFAGIAELVDRAYETVFERADVVLANSEGTMHLAARYGRDDAVLMPNGVDPGRFSTRSAAAGDRTVIGYGGKIGTRFDVGLIETVSRQLPECTFEFAGPILERSVGRALKRLTNVRLLGDVNYDDYPRVVSTWDIAWIPHAVGRGEVGGDAIKSYEYRAAGLPTLTTPIIGAGRADGVTVVEASDMVDALAALTADSDGPRVARQPCAMPAEHTWKYKAEKIAAMLGAASRSGAAGAG